MMKISARNVLKGKIKGVKHGSVNSEVTIGLAGSAQIVSIIAREYTQSSRRRTS